MNYKEYVGNEYTFEKGERVPQWLFENEDATFGENTLIIPLNNRVHWFAKVSGEGFFMGMSGKYPITQTCPQISWRRTQEEVFVYKR